LIPARRKPSREVEPFASRGGSSISEPDFALSKLAIGSSGVSAEGISRMHDVAAWSIDL
jgi:hypothetical protein